MKILFLSHYYPPEVNAPASRTSEHCTRWARAGHDVTVVTCAPNCPDGVVFPGYRNRFRPRVEMVDGVKVVRVWTYVAPNARAVKRIANFVSYMVSAILICLWLPRPDVVVATSPQFFCGWAGVWAARLKRRPFVLEVRDIWPESIRAVDALRNRWAMQYLAWLERRLYRAASHIITVGSGYRDRILQKYNAPERISVVTNGVDVEQFVPGSPDPRFLTRWNLWGKFVCSYVGTIGMAHGLSVVVRAARLLRDQGREDIRFCLVGDGACRERLEAEAEAAGVNDMIVFTGRLPREDVPPAIASSDACLIHLRGCELFSSVIPSKIFENMAMCKPMIMGVRGEACDIVREAGASVEMQPDSEDALASAVCRLADDERYRNRLGKSARAYVATYYSRDVLAQDMLQILCAIAESRTVEEARVPHFKVESASANTTTRSTSEATHA